VILICYKVSLIYFLVSGFVIQISLVFVAMSLICEDFTAFSC